MSNVSLFVIYMYAIYPASVWFSKSLQAINGCCGDNSYMSKLQRQLYLYNRIYKTVMLQVKSNRLNLPNHKVKKMFNIFNSGCTMYITLTSLWNLRYNLLTMHFLKKKFLGYGIHDHWRQKNINLGNTKHRSINKDKSFYKKENADSFNRSQSHSLSNSVNAYIVLNDSSLLSHICIKMNS